MKRGQRGRGWRGQSAGWGWWGQSVGWGQWGQSAGWGAFARAGSHGPFARVGAHGPVRMEGRARSRTLSALLKLSIMLSHWEVCLAYLADCVCRFLASTSSCFWFVKTSLTLYAARACARRFSLASGGAARNQDSTPERGARTVGSECR